MCEQLRYKGYNEHHLDFVQMEPSSLPGAAGQSIDSLQNITDITYERTRKAMKMGTFISAAGANGVLTKTSATE